MQSQGGYVTDRKAGVWTYWDENGNVTHTEEYSEWGGPK
jgi:antitoxin component YwqK of YwqJK toxin-antitoxin module